MPFEVNRTWGQSEGAPPPRVLPPASAAKVYQRLASLPPGTAVAEFPFGDAAWEIRYVYYASVHGKPILNGYSGAFPPGYLRRVAALRRLATDGDTAWRALVDARTTHAVVHSPAFQDPYESRRVMAWLESRGARLVDSFPEGDVLYELPAPR
jgi:hypothetical protein